MSISSVKKEILEALWKAEKPLHRDNIAKRIELPSNSTMGHLLGLIKARYVSVAEKHHYGITDQGKEALGFPKLNKKRVGDILSALPLEKAFHFFTGLDKSAGVHADSLDDFCRKILTIDLRSIEFHLPRRDFESWFNYLGDIELAKRMSLIREKHLFGETLRKELYNTVKSRRDELANLSRIPY